MSASVNIDDLKKAVDENVAPANESASNRIRYVLGPTSKRLILDRRHNTINPNEGANLSEIKDVAEVNFYMSGNVYVDTHTVILRGNLTVNPSGANSLKYTVDPYAGAFALLDRLNLKTLDGQEIETIEQVGMLAKILHTASCPQDYLSSAGQIWLGNQQHVTNKKPLSVKAATNRALNAFQTAVESKTFTYTADGEANLVNMIDSQIIPSYEDHAAGTWFGKQGKDFEIPLFHVMGIFKQTRYIPLGALQRLQLQVRFAAPQNIFTQVAGAATVPTYSISNLCLDYQTVRLHELLDLKIREKINQPGPEGGLRIDFQSYAYSGQAITASTAAVQVTKGCADALSCFTVLQRNSARGSGGKQVDADVLLRAQALHMKSKKAPLQTVVGTAPIETKADTHVLDDQKRVYYPSPTWYYQIGSEKIPENRVETFGRSYRYLQEALGRFGDINLAPMSMEDFSDSCFIMAANFENDEVSLSGMNYTGRTLYLGNSLTLQLDGLAVGASTDMTLVANQFGTDKPTANQLDPTHATYIPGAPATALGDLYAHAFLLYTKLLIVRANGQIRIQE